MKPIDILLDTNREYEKTRTFKINGLEVKTVFEDIEAFSLCGGIVNSPYPKNVWRRYFEGNSTDNDIWYAHTIAMKLKEKYGSEFIKYCMTLPPLPFKYGEVLQVFSEMDKAKEKLDNPIIRFSSTENERFYKLSITPQDEELDLKIQTIYGGEVNDINKETKHKFSLTFYTEKINGKVVYRDSSRLIFRDLTKVQKLATIHRDGTIEPFDNIVLTSPTISLFLNFAKDPLKMIISYGFQTGECSYCGRELTDRISSKYGYGKKCSSNYGLKYG